MLTQFVTLTIQQPASPAALQQAIAHALHTHGEPLRWAITAVDESQQTVQVEAVVTLNDGLDQICGAVITV